MLASASAEFRLGDQVRARLIDTVEALIPKLRSRVGFGDAVMPLACELLHRQQRRCLERLLLEPTQEVHRDRTSPIFQFFSALLDS